MENRLIKELDRGIIKENSRYGVQVVRVVYKLFNQKKKAWNENEQKQYEVYVDGRLVSADERLSPSLVKFSECVEQKKNHTFPFITLPENTYRIDPTDFETMSEFFIFTTKMETCQIYSNPYDRLSPMLPTKIFWVNKAAGLGYGMVQNSKTKEVIYYKFGTKDDWNRFKIGFAAQFKGDNS